MCFISLRLKYCLTCSLPFTIKVNIKESNCTVCQNSYESRYFFVFRCRCILCCHCLNHMVNQNPTMCYKSHELDKHSNDLAIEFLKVLGYNQNS